MTPNVAVIGYPISYGSRLYYRVAHLVECSPTAETIGVPGEQRYDRKRDAFADAKKLPGAIVDPRVWKCAGKAYATVRPRDDAA